MSVNRSLLGRSRPQEKLSQQERQAMDRSTQDLAATTQPPSKAASKRPGAVPDNAGKQARVRKDQLKFHWTMECPACGFKVSGSADPKPGQRLARCGRCKLALFLKRN